MFIGFEFNKECRKLQDRGVYAEEHNILCDFLASKHENVRLEYGNEKESLNASNALRRWIKDNRKPLKVAQRRNYVFAFKTIED